MIGEGGLNLSKKVYVGVFGPDPPSHRCHATWKNVEEAAATVRAEGIETTMKRLNIMSKGASLSWLMGQPHDVAGVVAVSRGACWKVVLVYMIIAWAGNIIFGSPYGALSGGL